MGHFVSFKGDTGLQYQKFIINLHNFEHTFNITMFNMQDNYYKETSKPQILHIETQDKSGKSQFDILNPKYMRLNRC